MTIKCIITNIAMEKGGQYVSAETSATMLSYSAVQGVRGGTHILRCTLYTTKFINHRGPHMLWKLIFKEKKGTNFERVSHNYFKINISEIFPEKVGEFIAKLI